MIEVNENIIILIKACASRKYEVHIEMYYIVLRSTLPSAAVKSH